MSNPDFSALIADLTESRAETAAMAAECVEVRRTLRRQVVTERARRRNAEARLAAIRALVEQARQVSPSDRMTLYVADVEVALGLRSADIPEVRKLGGNDGGGQ